MPSVKLEVPIFTPVLPSLPAATRLELSAPNSYPSGGLTPPLTPDLILALSAPRPPLRVMIRPRPAPAPASASSPDRDPDFIYTPDELSAMLASIRSFKEHLDPSRDGFVFGVLALPPPDDGSGSGSRGPRLALDTEANVRLIWEAAPFPCTFHRAFDDLLGAGVPVATAVDDVLACGFDGVLTSGGPGNAIDNLGVLADLLRAVDGRMDVLVGGGVRAANAERILGVLEGAERAWLHSSCLRAGGEEVDEGELRALADVIQGAAW
ncbi:uncharacterized protein DNG_02037 [Cephalotrichum gorgonifer]|uniref:Copper homeostasis protein cutC homolog n=1 Tax=Cephalotrichum gorgonifer TaxID=2041049 RepID=A0AAE8SS73_9PEZI|nr:uncharacterized protein DNG_02037 [Cephalotrichum gorgonifer]